MTMTTDEALVQYAEKHLAAEMVDRHFRAVIDARIAAAVAAEREAWREAAEASISHCRTDCTEESFCGQCEPLLAILTARGGK